MCVSANTNWYKPKCDNDLMNLLDILYDFKFFGSFSKKEHYVMANKFAKEYLRILEKFNSNPEKYSKKLHAICKSDTIIGPFYVFLGIIPPESIYSAE